VRACAHTHVRDIYIYIYTFLFSIYIYIYIGDIARARVRMRVAGIIFVSRLLGRDLHGNFARKKKSSIRERCEARDKQQE